MGVESEDYLKAALEARGLPGRIVEEEVNKEQRGRNKGDRFIFGPTTSPTMGKLDGVKPLAATLAGRSAESR